MTSMSKSTKANSMYLDSDDEEISVAYKRFDGGYGVIQAENKIKEDKK